MAIEIYDEQGIRFEYPEGWEVEVESDGTRTTISLQSMEGPAFAMIALDVDRPAPAEVADSALAALRQEYPGLEVVPALETIDGRPAIGHDVEFLSLDANNTCLIRCFRTDRRTVLIFGQWSDMEDGDPGREIQSLRSSLKETDS
ncbi:hypothetical protein BH23PLA1_BH23PLA1_44500 [soil metagenome]